ncbi:conserved hypothetical Ustilaginaceae-specific protein [Sporisorium reilianum SRZ2]|uniref:Conserved hypothetical Ustilaginaceae-specific protein n=1 Tax=Sporisorium reilianum (strain SRZ2) TaxID=999809 RepID=E6ZS87_SPORE|nr:conserved hypothetical Ustilaginaceae-specific protein [Sporisorium reilianum SRZ2]
MVHSPRLVLIFLLIALNLAVMQCAARSDDPPGRSSRDSRSPADALAERRAQTAADRAERAAAREVRIADRRNDALAQLAETRAARQAELARQQRAGHSIHSALDDIRQAHPGLPEGTFPRYIAHEPSQTQLFRSHLPHGEARMMLLSSDTADIQQLYASPIYLTNAIDGQARLNLLLFKINAGDHTIHPVGHVEVHPQVPYGEYSNFMDYITHNARDTWQTLHNRLGDLRIVEP